MCVSIDKTGIDSIAYSSPLWYCFGVNATLLLCGFYRGIAKCLDLKGNISSRQYMFPLTFAEKCVCVHVCVCVVFM